MQTITRPSNNPRFTVAADGLTAGMLTLKNAGGAIVYGPTEASGEGSLFWDTALPAGTYTASGPLTVAGTVIADALTGFQLQVIAVSAGMTSADLAFTLGCPVINILAPLQYLMAGSDVTVHVPVSATAQTDTDEVSAGTVIDLTSFPVKIAITRADPDDGDFQTALWLTRTVPPVGSFACLSVGPDTDNALPSGNYRVYVEINLGSKTVCLRTPGYLPARG